MASTGLHAQRSRSVHTCGIAGGIGIIALLIAILLPALNRARAQAKAVSCLANVRQIATAGQMYASDYKVYVGYPPDRKAALYKLP